MQKSALFVSLVCALFLCASVSAQTLKINAYSSSNNYWLAVTAIDGTATTSSIAISEGGSTWTILPPVISGWGYWVYSATNSNTGFTFPLSFRLTSVNGDVVTINSAFSSFTGVEQTADSATQYAATSTPAEATDVPIAATEAPIAATEAPIAATDAPVAATDTPIAATDAPVAVATAVPVTPATCTTKVKVMVPLYVYPGAAWDAVAAGASSVSTLAIINPNSGPASSPDSSYVTYMQKLSDAGVEMVGYVYTGYGTRAISAVKADIDTYATQYPLLKGIFLDEGAAGADMVSYYQALHDYILSMPGWTHDIVNPGIVPDSGYLAASTQIVSFENYGTSLVSAGVPSFAQCSNKDQFVAIVHTVVAASMEPIIDAVLSLDYFGYIYVTDGLGGCCTYNTLTTYYASMVAYIASKQ